MKKRKFLLNLFFLTSATLIAKIIGIIFRIYMSNKIGSEGIGLYQLVTTVYFFASTFTTSGLTLAVTRIVANSVAKGNYGVAKFTVSRCILIGFFISSVISSVIFNYSEYLSQNVLNDLRAVLPLKILSISLPFVSISSCFRGYFFAVRKIINTASEQLLEQIIEILIFALLIGSFLPKGLEYACCAVVIGTSFAEFLSCFYSYFLYRKDMKQKKLIVSGGKRNIYKTIASISLPVTMSSVIKSGLHTTENILIPKNLQKSGMSKAKSLAGYGLINGMVMPIIGFPSVFLFSFALLLIPELSEANSFKKSKYISKMTTKIFDITFLYSIMLSGMFLFYFYDFSFAVYGTRESGIYIKMLSPIVPLMYLDGVVDCVLKGLNEQMHYLYYSIVDSLSRILFIFVMLPRFGMKGLIFVMAMSAIVSVSMSMLRVIKITSIKINIKNWLLKPTISIVLSCFAVNEFFKYFSITESITPIFNLTLKLIFTFVSYVIILFLGNCVRGEDLLWVKNWIEKNEINKVKC